MGDETAAIRPGYNGSTDHKWPSYFNTFEISHLEVRRPNWRATVGKLIKSSLLLINGGTEIV